MAFSLVNPSGLDGKTLAATQAQRESNYLVPGDDSLLSTSGLSSSKSQLVTVTGYSSTEDQTDDTPFITASGKTVRSGVVAANWLPLGAKVRIPAVYGDRVFVVEDRMHPRNAEKMDIWFSTREEALKFGVKKLRVEIL